MILLQPFIAYARDPRRLRRFTSPSIGALTPLWLMYRNCFGKGYTAAGKAYRRLGPILRTAPNHISFADPAKYKDIYGHSTPAIKDNGTITSRRAIVRWPLQQTNRAFAKTQEFVKRFLAQGGGWDGATYSATDPQAASCTEDQVSRRDIFERGQICHR